MKGVCRVARADSCRLFSLKGEGTSTEPSDLVTCCCWRWNLGGSDFWYLLNSCAGDPASLAPSSLLLLWATAGGAVGASSENVLGAPWAENSGEPRGQITRKMSALSSQKRGWPNVYGKHSFLLAQTFHGWPTPSPEPRHLLTPALHA